MSYQAQIPYGAYWSTPFARWQGSFAHLHSVEFAAQVARRELARRDIDAARFDYGVLGFSVPQQHSFYGLPWFMGLVGAARCGGPTLMQACATGVRTLLAAAQEIEVGLATTALVVNCDRTSNGPHLYYPNPRGPGGTGAAEDWVMDNFGCDPLGRHSMLATAENVAARHGFGTGEQHEVVLHREAQYAQARAAGSAFLKRFMSLPFDVPAPGTRKSLAVLEGDEGVSHSTPERLAALQPVTPGGTVTYGGQTHPADGNAALIVTTRERARELATDPKIAVRLHGFG
ncbi:MAG: thiolase family protein, partial [Burkholderiaceae bacterium]